MHPTVEVYQVLPQKLQGSHFYLFMLPSFSWKRYLRPDKSHIMLMASLRHLAPGFLQFQWNNSLYTPYIVRNALQRCCSLPFDFVNNAVLLTKAQVKFPMRSTQMS